MPGSTLCVLYSLSYEVGIILTVPILQDMKLSLTEVKQLAQGQIAIRWWASQWIDYEVNGSSYNTIVLLQ